MKRIEINCKTGEEKVVELTAEEISLSVAAIAEEDKHKYRDLRLSEYPNIGDQLDALMKWLATEKEFSVPSELKSIAMKCMSVKAKYPKPEENK